MLKLDDFVDVYCADSNSTLDLKLDCFVYGATDSDDKTLMISDSNNKNLTFNFTKNNSINTIGINIPSLNLSSLTTISSTYDAILPNTEFELISNITGLEFYMAANGRIDFYVSFSLIF